MASFSGMLAFVRTVWRRVQAENVTFMAGSIAYQAFLSLVPLLVLTIFFLSLIGGEQLATRITALLDTVLTPDVAPIVRAAFRVHPTASASFIGMITLVWGVFRVFRGLDTAFSEIYGTQAANTLVTQVVDGLVAVVALLGSLFATTLAATVFAALAVPSIGVLIPLLLVINLSIAFFPMYWRFPNTDVSLSETVPGVIVAAVGWTMLQAVFEAYVAVVGRLDTAGVLGAMLLLLVWLYLDSLLLLLGAVVNAVVADSNSTDVRATGAGSDETA